MIIFKLSVLWVRGTLRLHFALLHFQCRESASLQHCTECSSAAAVKQSVAGVAGSAAACLVEQGVLQRMHNG